MIYRNYKNSELVSIAVALLGGETEYIDREDIAIKVNELSPGRFNWKKYPSRIDLVAVGVALRDAKKEKNGGLLLGNNSIGWMLSPKGIKWLINVDLSDFVIPNSQNHRKHSIAEFQELERDRLRRTRAYELYINGEIENISPNDFNNFVRINEYFQSKSRQRRYSIIDNAVVGDDELSTLWYSLKQIFLEENN